MSTPMDMPCGLSLIPSWPKDPVYTSLPESPQVPPLPPCRPLPFPAGHANFTAPLLDHTDSFISMTGVREMKLSFWDLCWPLAFSGPWFPLLHSGLGSVVSFHLEVHPCPPNPVPGSAGTGGQAQH